MSLTGSHRSQVIGLFNTLTFGCPIEMPNPALHRSLRKELHMTGDFER
jgi:hypothetical protein